jgi:phospho-N-acetylmuramoyl-pentapeptide-transferase
MFYHLALYFKPYWSWLNVVHYVSFRAMAAFLSTLGLSFLTGGLFIEVANRLLRAPTRPWIPERHKAKGNLPTMGGIFIISLVVIDVLLWCDLTKPSVWLMIGLLIGFGAIGVHDDWAKIKQMGGISARLKFGLQCLISLIVVLIWFWGCDVTTTITLPFFKGMQLNIGWLFMPWAVFIIVGCSNAVNLTDGLDGLAIGSLIPNFALFSMLCYLAGNMVFADYLHIPYAGTAEIAIIGTILVAASLSFLWYNAYPAQIFMGDVGSLSLGAALAFMALLCKQELLLVISGGVFVAETLSVIIQLASLKVRGTRVFRMAPMHHHFELIGWQEAKITVRFGIISLILCILALITIKVR